MKAKHRKPGFVLLCLTMAVWQGFTNQIDAAHISEVYLPDSLADVVPFAVELDGLIDIEFLQLVVIDAGDSQYGQVLNVIDIPVQNSVELISDEAWPVDLWHCTNPGKSICRTLESIAYNASFDLTGARSLFLLDGKAPFREHASLFDDAMQRYYFDRATILDVLTFGPDAAARPYGDEVIIDSSMGTVISRPYDLDGELVNDTFLVGCPDIIGRFQSEDEISSYYVTPGLTNPVWEPAHAPEIATVMAIIPFSVFCLARRRIR